MTYPFNMTRSPAATVCVGLTSAGLPVGLQLVGPQHADLVVLRSAAALEAALGFDAVAPDPAGLSRPGRRGSPVAAGRAGAATGSVRPRASMPLLCRGPLVPRRPGA